MRLRVRGWVVATLVLSAGLAFAQDQPKPEQMKKMYEDALAQLKAAQDRKNELAMQNEQLTAKVAEQAKELEQLRAERVELTRRDAEAAERTFFLRSHYAAWQGFVKRDAELKVRWEAFLGEDVLAVPTTVTQDRLLDPEWPLAGG